MPHYKSAEKQLELICQKFEYCLAELKRDLIRWMFILSVAQFSGIVGLVFWLAQRW